MLSKSFGYALRGIIYVALTHEKKERVQVEEIAESLAVPRHFLGKIMKKVVKEGILESTRGPYGGFSINAETLQTPLIKLIRITEGLEQFNSCVLHFRKCKGPHYCHLATFLPVRRF
ncbi:MAG: Rrf2 family transcriptional regulator [Chitinophagaceae bacterium]|nr:Rrf2 family transcriptional regulator [Chitinophagaceae bacterium]